MLAEGSVGSDGPLENDARLRHGGRDDVWIVALLRHSLVKQIAVGAPSFESRLHRRSGNRLIEEDKRGLIGLQFSRHKCLPREQRIRKTSQQRRRPGIYLDAAGLSQRMLRERAAEYADGRDLRFPRCGGIVGRVADRDGISAPDIQLTEDDLEDVGRRLRFLDVVRRSRYVDQVGDARDVEVLPKLVLLCRRRDCDPKAGITHALEKVRDRRERTHQRQVFRLETIAPPLFQFLAVVPLFVGGQEYGNELVSALADLASSLLEADVVTELDHGFLPCERMQIHRNQQRAVQVENRGFRQFKVLQGRSETVPHTNSRRAYFSPCYG